MKLGGRLGVNCGWIHRRWRVKTRLRIITVLIDKLFGGTPKGKLDIGYRKSGEDEEMPTPLCFSVGLKA